jgi:filamentous hemagglutinin family protein
MAACNVRLSTRFLARRPRSGFARRLALWARHHAAGVRRAALRPLACAALLAVTGAYAAPPANLALPKPLTGTTQVKVRGKTYDYTWQMHAKTPSVLGAVQTSTQNGNGGNKTTVKQVLTQYDRRAIYNWLSFDIGEDATFEFDMRGGAGSSALNRVVNSLAPSQIFGKLNANGEVFLINRNGVMFGPRSQVNVQGLVASMLNMDDDVFLGGLAKVDTTAPSFAWDSEDGMATYDSEKNYVKVEAGAKITTPAGGRVILLAPTKVINAGEISTPGGQTALVAGEKVYLRSPSTEPIYASEINEKIPALRGLLFEVDGRGEAVNLGRILTERGNTTMMAHVVRQGGAIKATTSVAENGSVFLLARSGKQEVLGEGDPFIRSRDSGELILGAGSTIEITPDNSTRSSASVKMTASRIELSGQTIDIGENASIKAPGAVVNIRAMEGLPDYVGVGAPAGKDDPYRDQTAQSKARIVMRQGASIDVSGTQDSEVSVARHFVTTEFLRNADLSGTPFLKDGALLNSKVTYDTRSAPTVLEAASHQGYLNSIQTTAGERMANAGTVTMATTGAVLMQTGATVNVSGGRVTFTDAVVSPTRLYGADGKTYTLNTARPDVQIAAASGQQATDPTRFGIKVPNEAYGASLERGYTHGGDGGAFNVQAPVMALDGQVRANVQIGERQALGFERPKQTAIRLGLSTNSNMLGGVNLFKNAIPAQAALWADPLIAALPDRSALSAAMLNASGAGHITIQSDGGVVVADGADLTLQHGGSLSLTARGPEGLILGGSIKGAGATVKLITEAPAMGTERGGDIVVKDGQSIDVSGNFVNKRLDGSGVASAMAGGQVSVLSAEGLSLGKGTSIDVSGGATVSATGTVTGTRAGSITLEANNAVRTPEVPFGAVSIDNTVLSGYSLAGSTRTAGDAGDGQSGKLRIKVGEVDIVGKRSDTMKPLTVGTAKDGIMVDERFFHQGGFSKFDIEGSRKVDVAAGAVVAPTPKQWTARPLMISTRSGSRLASLVNTEVLSPALRPAVTVSLRSPGPFGNTDLNNGDLTLTHGSIVDAGQRGAVVLQGGRSIVLAGTVKAAGGSIETDLVGVSAESDPDARFSGIYRIDAGAVLDVSGEISLSSTAASGRRAGSVLDGGTIQIKNAKDGAANTAIVIAGAQTAMVDGKPETILPAAMLKADGTSGLLDVTTIDAQGLTVTRRDMVESRGGSIHIGATEAGALLAGDMSAHAGGGKAQGGQFNLTMTNTRGASTGRLAAIVLQQAAVSDKTARRDEVLVSADALSKGGFDSASFTQSDRIETDGAVQLNMKRNLLLSAPVLMARANSVATLSAGSRLAWQATNAVIDGKPQGGTGKMTLKGDVIDLIGNLQTGSTGELNLQAGSLLRLSATNHQGPASAGDGIPLEPKGLTTAADVHITAPLVTVATAKAFTLDASGHKVTIDGGNPNAEKPLSAGGSLTVKAQTIDHQGVIHLPFGEVTLSADTITLGDQSVISVSGDGLKLPYGSTSQGGAEYKVNGETIKALPEKAITLNTDKGVVTLEAGSTVDLSAGGQLLGWEFVPGPGGTKDVFQGVYETGAFAVVPTVKGPAPMDPGIFVESGINDLGAYQGMTRQITFGDGGPIPAGTYAVLPARYALMEGSYLVRTTSATPMAPGAALRRNDGSSLVGAVVSARGVGQVADKPAAFEVLTREAALRFSEIRETKADDFFGKQADRLGVQIPRLARDAGALNLVANKMTLEGRMLMKRQTDGRGGELNISADSIWLGSGQAPADALRLDVGQLNDLGVDSLLLGGQRQTRQADGARQVLATAANVTLGDMSGEALALSDVVLVAKDKVELREGAAIIAKSTTQSTGVPADSLEVIGDGGLIRVSADDTAVTVRRGTPALPITREQGQVRAGGNTVLSGGAVTIEATKSTVIDDTADIRARQLTLGASRIVVGDKAAAVAGAEAGTEALVIGQALAARLAGMERATLRSFGGVDFAGQGTLGGAAQKSLTIDTHQINLLPQSEGRTTASIEAGSVTLTNTTGIAGMTQEGGNGQLSIAATGKQGTDGLMSWRDGVVAVSGDAATQARAAGGMVFSSRREVDAGGVSRTVQSGLTVSGSLDVAAPVLTATNGAMGKLLAASGDMTLSTVARSGAPARPAAGLGGTLDLSAQAIHHQGLIDLPSGAVNVNASVGDITFASNSVTKVDGQVWHVDGLKIATPGGSVKAVSPSGNITVQSGALISASAPAGIAGAQAGDIQFLAPRGTVTLDGTVRALSDGNQKGGSLTISALNAPTVGQIVDKLAQSVEGALDPFKGQGATRANMAGKLHLHQRAGDITVDGSTTVKSGDIKMVADAGSVLVRGELDASGTVAGQVVLIASGKTLEDGPVEGGVTVAGGAEVNASATGASEAGGQVTLSTTHGTVVVEDGSMLDLSGGTGGNGGKLVLRAAATASFDDAAGEYKLDGDVKIAAIGGQLKGVGEVIVQGVKTQDIDMLDDSHLASIKEASKAFIGNAAVKGTLDRVLNGKAGDAVRARMVSAHVLQSAGDLSLDSAWNLDDFALIKEGTRYSTQHLGGNPMDITFRAAGMLTVGAGLSSGFAGKTSLPGALTTLANANKELADARAVNPLALIMPGEGASFHLVAGAELGSADHMATAIEAKEFGHVVIGSGSGDPVIVRTTTGDIHIAAAGDVRFVNEGAAVYTTGRLISDEQAAGAAGFNPKGTGHDGVMTGSSGRQRPFLTHGGRVSLDAGSNIELLQSMDAAVPHVSDWFVAREGSASAGAGARSEAWWSRYDLFRQGIATFGGGDITARAGGDIRNLGFIAADSAFKSNMDGSWHRFGGGSVDVSANGAVLGVTVQATGDRASIHAGTHIGATPERGALQMFHGHTTADVLARQDIEVDRISAVGMLDQRSVGKEFPVFGLGEGSSLDLTSAGGDIRYTGAFPPGYAASFDHVDLWADDVRVAAPSGSVAVSKLTQASSRGTQLGLLAHDDLSVDRIDVFANRPWSTTLGMEAVTLAEGTFGSDIAVFRITKPDVEPSDRREPIRLVAQQGDAKIDTNIGGIANPVRIIAGRDVNLPRLHVQHQTESELSVIRAGRDINMSGTDTTVPDIKIHGPGDLLVMAGRDVNITTPAGVQAMGNRENIALPDGSAHITVMAGVDPAGADYTNALRQYFHVLGGAGVAEWHADLYAQIVALRGGQDAPLPGSPAASAFAAQSFQQKLAQARELVGETSYQQAVLDHMRGRSAKPEMTLAQAMTEMTALPQRERDLLVGKVLAGTWVSAMSAHPDAMQATVAAMSEQRGQPYAQALIDFVKQRTGQAPATLVQALERFSDDTKVSAELRVLFANKVLRNEVRAAGALAGQVTDGPQAKFDAYQRGFNAIETLFPGSKERSNIQMGSSNIKSLQNSALTLVVPHGGLNVGQLTGENNNAANLGIVTSAGGDINAITRDSIEVNQSRIFTVGKGDMLLWSSFGDIDAGKGAKTVVGAPPPVYRVVNGKVEVDTSGSFSGSGIAALDPDSELHLYAPRGTINAGDAGIRALGKLSLGADRIVGANDIKLSNGGNLAPPPVSGNAATSIGSLGQSATSAGDATGEDEAKRDKPSKRQLMLELLGFGPVDREDDKDDDKKDQ